jgi:hypothetical protein
MILHLKEPKKTHQKTFRYHKHFQKVAGYKMAIPKPIAFLYTNNEQTKKIIKKTTPFTIASQNT